MSAVKVSYLILRANRIMIKAITVSFRIAAPVAMMEEVRMPELIRKYITQISVEQNMTVGHPCRKSDGKKAPNVSLSITA